MSILSYVYCRNSVRKRLEENGGQRKLNIIKEIVKVIVKLDMKGLNKVSLDNEGQEGHNNMRSVISKILLFR